MAANPLENDPEREHRIRMRAYHLWHDEGRPHGRAEEFWERARELVGMEDSAGAGLLPNPQAAGVDPSLPEGIEEAFLQENLGEFPGPFTDQGDREETPEADHHKRGAIKAEPEGTIAPRPARKTTGVAAGQGGGAAKPGESQAGEKKPAAKKAPAAAAPGAKAPGAKTPAAEPAAKPAAARKKTKG